MDVEVFEIIWTDKVVFDLSKIYQFLFVKLPTAARKEIEKIYLKVSLLEKGFTKIGQQESLLKDYKKQYRYLISGNYKIIYHVFGVKIFINTLFDSRQNPKKLKVNND